jgi:hypothetical protein
MSVAYEIYKEAVGGKTFDGKDMKQYEEMPENIRNAWTAVDNHYTKKPEITESATYELYKSRNKDAKDFEELPESIKRTFASIDKNYSKIVKQKEPKAPKPKVKKEAKQKPQPKKEKKPESKPAKPVQMLTTKNIF